MSKQPRDGVCQRFTLTNGRIVIAALNYDIDYNSGQEQDK